MGIADWATHPEKDKPKTKTVKVKAHTRKVVDRSADKPNPKRSATVDNALAGVVGPSPRKPAPKPKPKPPARKSQTVDNALAGIVGKPSPKRTQPKRQQKHGKSQTVEHALQGLVGGNQVDRAIQSLVGGPLAKPPRKKKSGGLTNIAASTAGSVGAHALAELQGKGVISPLATTLGTAAGKTFSVPAAVISGDVLPKGGLRSALHIATLPTSAPLKFASNVARESVEIPAEAIPSLYHLLEPAIGHGDLKETGRRFAQPYKETFGSTKGLKKGLTEHPLSTALLITGAEGAVGGVAGRAARSGALGRAAQRYADLDRVSAKGPDSSFVEKRHASKNLTHNRLQKASDRRNIAKADAKRREADRVEAEARRPGADPTNLDHSLARATRLRHEANVVDPRVADPKAIRRAVNETVDANEGIRRQHTQAELAKVDKIIEPVKKHAGAVRAVAESQAPATIAGLEAYLGKLNRAFDGLKARDVAEGGSATVRHKMRANADLRASIAQTIKDARAGKVDLADLKARAEAWSAARNALDHDLAVKGVINPEQAARRALLPYAVQQMGLKFDADAGAFRDASGNAVSLSQIRAHLQRNPDFNQAPAYLSQAPNMKGSRNYFLGVAEPRAARGSRYEGTATLEGTHASHAEAFRESSSLAKNLVETNNGFRRIIDQLGAKRPDGKAFKVGTKAEAEKFARELREKGSPYDWTPVRLNPLGADKSMLASLDAEVTSAAHTSLIDKIGAAVRGEPGDGPWGLLPKPAADTLFQHTRTMGGAPGMRAFRQYNSMFRQQVLSTSPKWLIANQVEATVRGAMKGSLPIVTKSYWQGRRLLDQLPPEIREQVVERGVGQGHYGFAKRNQVYNPSEFDGRLGRAAGAVRQSAPARAVVHAWDRYTHVMFNEINGRIERQFRVALAGKYASDHLLPKEGLRLARDAYAQAAQGLTHTETQVAMGRYVDRAYGRYGKFSPAEKTWIANYTPFMAWSANAVRFLLTVLPKDHPVLMSVVVAAGRESEDWRETKGLTQFASGKGDRLPRFLQNSIPSGDGGHYRVGGLTPFGLASDFLGNAESLILPQLQGLMKNAEGNEWTGRPIRAKDGGDATQADSAAAILSSVAHALVPGLSAREQIADKGVGGWLNPVRESKSKPKKKVAAGGGGTGGWGYGGSSGGSSSGGGSGTGGWGY